MLALLSLTHVSGESPQPDHPLSIANEVPALRQIMDEASKNSPRLQILEKRREIHREDRKVSDAAVLPRANFYGETGFIEEKVNDDWYSRGDTFARLSVTQPLFHWGALVAEKERGRISEATSLSNIRNEAKVWQAQLEKAWVDAVTRKLNLSINQWERDQARERRDAQRALVDAGNAPEATMGEIDLQYQEREVLVQKAETEWQASVARLKHLAGLSPSASLDIPEELPTSTPFMESIRRVSSQLLNSEDDLYTQQFWEGTISSEEQNLKIQRSSLRPKVDLLLSVSLDNDATYFQDSLSDNQRFGFFGGIRVNWNIFDGFSSQARVQASLQRIRQFQAEKDYRLTEDTNRVKELLNLLESMHQLVQIREVREAWAKELLLEVKKDLDAGRVPVSAVNNQQRALFQTRYNTLQSKAEFYRYLADLMVLDFPDFVSQGS